jgi:hypothetical protein
MAGLHGQIASTRSWPNVAGRSLGALGPERFFAPVEAANGRTPSAMCSAAPLKGRARRRCFGHGRCPTEHEQTGRHCTLR